MVHTNNCSVSAALRWKNVPMTQEEVLERLREMPKLYQNYKNLDEVWRQRFLDFCAGKKTLPLTYDPIFKRIFHPDVHPHRLSRLISSLLGMNVKILRILPSEDRVLDETSLLIMDMLGELEDGSLVNIEIQKQGYAFPAERISCYSSDLVMRQYARVRSLKGESFKYPDIKKVYIIVLFEKSIRIFHEQSEHYLHYGKTVFDTGLPLELLQEYCLVALDVFRSFAYDKIRNEQTAWLSLLCTENLEDAERLIQEYPWLEEIYIEIAMLRQNPEEVLGMFSEALRILDRNTVKYMIEQMQDEIDRQGEELSQKDEELSRKDEELQKALERIKELESQR